MPQEFRPTEWALIRKENSAIYRQHDNMVATLEFQARNVKSLADLQRVYESATRHDVQMWNEHGIRTYTVERIQPELYHAVVRLSETHQPIPLATVAES